MTLTLENDDDVAAALAAAVATLEGLEESG
jgi:hypothetical protein